MIGLMKFYRLIKLILFAMIIYIVYGTLVFWGPWTRPSDYFEYGEQKEYDLGVIFTGGGGKRIDVAFGLLISGHVDTLLISSASTSRLDALSQKYQYYDSFPYIPELYATSTHGNAYYSSKLIRSSNKHNILLITNDYHMKRAYRLLWLALRRDDVKITCCPVDEYRHLDEKQKLNIGSYRKLVVAEKVKIIMNYIKFLYNGAVISGNSALENEVEVILDTHVMKMLYE